MVYRPLIGQVDVRILHSTWPITPDWLDYILSIAFGVVLAIGRSGLVNDTRQIST